MNEKRRNSKRSAGGRKRQGSSASRHAPRPSSAGSEKRADHSATSTTNRNAVQKPKKSGMSKFFAIFNCCSPPESSQLIDADSPEAARKANTRPSQSQSTQDTPPMKQESTSGLESKEARQEKAAANSTFPKNPVATNDKKLPASPREHDGSKAMPELPPEVTARESLNKPLPASPKAPGNPSASMIATGAALGGGAAAAGAVGASVAENRDVITQSGAEQSITDRTPEQAKRDEDIEMTDAPPSLPLASSDVPTLDDSSKTTSTAPRVDIPPPPPPADRQVQIAQAEVPEPRTQTASLASQTADDKIALLPSIRPEHKGRKCLVLDLDETLVHSSFKILHQADFTIPVEIEGQYHNVYVIKRPGVDQFMKRVGELYEVVVFTASVSKVRNCLSFGL